MAGVVTTRRALGLLAMATLAAGVGLAVRSGDLLGWLERASVDARFSLRGAQPAPPDVALVAIDNDSLGVLPRYPFSRTLHARVIEHLHSAGARLIVYDISFDRPTTPAADETLLEAAGRASPIIFSTSLISPSGATEVLGGNAQLRALGDRAAAADMLPDGDGVIRHLLGRVSHLPTVAAAVAQELGVGGRDLARLQGGWIDFAGPPGTVREVPFARVLNGNFDKAAIRGKVVVVGATAPVLQDLHSTAVGSPMSGPEVQADAISTVLQGFPLHSPSELATVLLIVLLGSVVPIAGVRLGSLGVAIVAVLALALWSLATQLTFNAGVVLDYSDPLASLCVGTSGAMALGLWADSRERARLRELFAAGSGEVVEQVLAPAGPRRLEPTAIIAGYKIENVVGRGGMGVVYRASQLALERDVAVKLIAPDRARDEVFRVRFKAESRMAAAIEHPNVIPVYEAGEDDGLLFIVMRLVDGIDMAQLLGREKRLEPARAVALIGQLAGALDAAHALGLVHRDVKPANALITFDQPEHVYLTDFGVAMHIGGAGGVTSAGQWVGTLDYLAPEQIHGRGVGPSADIYALTGVVYHCIAGEVPFPRDNEAAKLWAHVNAPPPRPSALCKELPGAADDVIARGMDKEPERRFATASELALACARALGVATTLPGPSRRPLLSRARAGRESASRPEPTVVSEQ